VKEPEVDEISNTIQADHHYPVTRADLAELSAAQAQAEAMGEDPELVRQDFVAGFRARAELGPQFSAAVDRAKAMRAAGDRRTWAAIYSDVIDVITGNAEPSDDQLAQLLAYGGDDGGGGVAALLRLRPNLTEERAGELLNAIQLGSKLESRTAMSEILASEGDPQEIDYQSAIAQIAQARKGRDIDPPTEYTVTIEDACQ
jgi:hypothetical protein